MNFKFTQKIALFALILASSQNVFGQAELVTEGFEGTTFLPTGWAGVGNTNLWSRRTTANTNTNPTVTPYAGDAMMRFNTRGANAGATQTISSPNMDLSSRGTSNNSYFSFYIYRDTQQTQDDSITISINTSRSLTGAKRLGVVARYAKSNLPDIVAEGWQKYSFAIPSTYTGANNYILITGTDRGGFNQGSVIYMDEIEWQHFPTYCKGKPSAGSITSNPKKICAAFGNVTFTVNGNSTGSGISIQWQTRLPADTTWTNVGAGENPRNVNGLNASRYYRVIVTCSKSSESDTADEYLIETNAGTPPTISVTPTNTTLCPGASLAKLVATATGNSTFAWTPATGLDMTTGDTVYSGPTATTNYTVTATDTAGCTASAFARVTISAGPNVTLIFADTMVCKGDSLLVTAQVGGFGNTYSWSTGSNTNATYVTPNGSTTATVTVKNNAQCETVKSQTFYSVDKPEAQFNYKQNGFTFDFINTSVGGDTYWWQFGDGNESFLEKPSYTFSKAGPITVKFIVSQAPCGADTFVQTLNPQPLSTGFDKFQIAGVEIYPNPASDAVQVFIPESYEKATLSIKDLRGVTIQNIPLKNNNNTLQVGNIPNGLYLFEFEVDRKVGIYKLNINH